MDRYDTERKARQLVALLDLMSCATKSMSMACGDEGIEILLCLADDMASEVLDGITGGNFLSHSDKDCLSHNSKEKQDEETHERSV
ncbi:hypothetical protein C7410_10833 [Paraburkholderia silvatlantica]|uniref:Uncharacterized protein n=1 Tax=Paraburkholderia silvatlantica TaxID=321895 RepID=A0A2V4TPI9_9BURK|nr:hypothetical protein [Paraburkholderia silvatlantica]PYE23138.1 hypothetical protein C7410_10833 [Paraburkholderia silvatlantica]